MTAETPDEKMEILHEKLLELEVLRLKEMKIRTQHEFIIKVLESLLIIHKGKEFVDILLKIIAGHFNSDAILIVQKDKDKLYTIYANADPFKNCFLKIDQFMTKVLKGMPAICFEVAGIQSWSDFNQRYCLHVNSSIQLSFKIARKQHMLICTNNSNRAFNRDQLYLMEKILPIVIQAMINIENARKLRKKNKIIYFQASHDNLTGLINRQKLLDFIDYFTSFAGRSKMKFAILYLDLCKFKKINDVYGHDAGDLVLKKISQGLNQCMRKTDYISRPGGDEFVVVISKFETKKKLKLVIDKIFQVISKPILYKSHKLSINVSIGITLYPRDGKSTAELINKADLAMYAAKKETRENNYRFYDGI